MTDLPARAARAGVAVNVTGNPEKTAPYDVILTDVPCSGSGSWRRDPQGKWALTPEKLAEVTTLQASILDTVAPMVAPQGVLAYASGQWSATLPPLWMTALWAVFATSLNVTLRWLHGRLEMPDC